MQSVHEKEGLHLSCGTGTGSHDKLRLTFMMNDEDQWQHIAARRAHVHALWIRNSLLATSLISSELGIRF